MTQTLSEAAVHRQSLLYIDPPYVVERARSYAVEAGLAATSAVVMSGLNHHVHQRRDHRPLLFAPRSRPRSRDAAPASSAVLRTSSGVFTAIRFPQAGRRGPELRSGRRQQHPVRGANTESISTSVIAPEPESP